MRQVRSTCLPGLGFCPTQQTVYGGRMSFRLLALTTTAALALGVAGTASAAPGDLDTSFTPPTLNGSVFSIAGLSDGKYLIGGQFTDAGGDSNTDYVARLNADGTRDTSFTPPTLDNLVYAVAALSDGKYLIGGGFTDAGGDSNSDYVARIEGAGAPGTPTSASATAGDAQATISWSAPSSNGGAAITSYTATASPGGATCTTSSTSCTITGLANGTSYTFTVTATNSAGTSAASSASASVTPADPPESSPAPTPVPTPASPATANEATSSPSLTVRLLPSRRSLRAGQAMRLGVRTSNSPSTGTAMARRGGQMASATAEDVRTCVRLPANLVVTRRPAGSLRSGRTVCWDSTGIPAGQQRTTVLRVRAIAVRGGSHAISASARSTAGTQSSARATAKTWVRTSPRAPRLPVTG